MTGGGLCGEEGADAVVTTLRGPVPQKGPLPKGTGLVGEEPIELCTLNVSQRKRTSRSELYHRDELEQQSALPQ